jgi:hypothetical protein
MLVSNPIRMTPVERYFAEHGSKFLMVRLDIQISPKNSSPTLRLVQYCLHRKTYRKGQKVFPRSNDIGAKCLLRVLEQALEQEGGEGFPGGMEGVLNECEMIFVIRDKQQAVRCVLRELEKLGLTIFAEIGVWDATAPGWHSVFPDPAKPFKGPTRR